MQGVLFTGASISVMILFFCFCRVNPKRFWKMCDDIFSRQGMWWKKKLGEQHLKRQAHTVVVRQQRRKRKRRQNLPQQFVPVHIQSKYDWLNLLFWKQMTFGNQTTLKRKKMMRRRRKKRMVMMMLRGKERILEIMVCMWHLQFINCLFPYGKNFEDACSPFLNIMGSSDSRSHSQGCQNKLAAGAFHHLLCEMHWLLWTCIAQFYKH